MLTKSTLASILRRMASAGVSRLRSFNRRYTEVLGLLNERLDGSAFSLSEAHILYELAHEREQTAADIARRLRLDPGQLSRILKGFEQRGLIAGETSPNHARHRLLSLTPVGREAFAKLDSQTQTAIGALLERFDPYRRARLVELAGQLEDLLAGGEQPVIYRPPRTGDIGWVTHRQALLYGEEYGWDWTYEALVARILGEFVAEFHAARDDAWIAELNGDVVGSIFLKGGDAGTAKLRLLYAEPSARGCGIGAELVRLCVGRARMLGYARLELWTNSVLASARRIYEAAGFELVEEKPHHSFGQDLVGQTWALSL
jgi:DNA-binding MarR family transcriptional regulator/N-acetylglutamate synthase-like GNAT family acetyltransferase